MRAPHYFRRLNILEDEAFTYGQRIALGQLFEGEAENEYGRLLKAFRIVYEYSPRLLPRSVRFSRITALVEELKEWISREQNLDFQNIMGVLITHDHADHIRTVGTLGERVKLPIYTTAEIHAGIDRNYGVREKLRTSRRYFEKGKEWQLFGMTINTFGIEHDSTDCLGYCIDYNGQRFVLMTDCGWYFIG